jgi:carbon-monoxide dehydrogenase large subunit
MSYGDTSTDWATAKFGIGQPVPRTEDPKLLRGQGRYTDDITLPNQVYAYVVRSPHAHGTLRGVDIAEARAMPGVLGIWTGTDLNAAGYGTLNCIVALKNRDGSDMRKPVRHSFATDKVRYVGDPVAVVVAETLAQAKDAAETVSLDIDVLPAVTRAVDAARSGAPQLYADVPNNVVLNYHFGDAGKVKAAFARAAHVAKLSLVNNRLVVSAMEPRSANVAYDKASGRWTVHIGCQGAFGLRNQLANDVLKVKPEQVRVLVGNVGGSFGMKAQVYPEYAALCHAARLIGRPVKWADERSNSFLSDSHGRDHEVTAELALDTLGKFLAIRITSHGNMGAYLGVVAPLMSTVNAVKNTISVYGTELIEVSTKCVVTNTSPVSAYRGAGRPEGNYYMERLIESAAAAMKIDGVELRRRNHIRPEQLPYKAPSEMTYDSGNFPAVLDRVLKAADWNGFEARRQQSKARGRLRGRGIGQFLEVTAPPNKEMGGIRFEADGTVTIITGTLDYGQGHAAPFAQVLTSQLGIPFERIRLLQGDSDELVVGGGTGGSRSAMCSGSAIVQASAQVIERGKQIAGHVLEAAPADIEFGKGEFRIVGTDRRIGVLQLAEKLRGGMKLPDGMPASLDVKLAADPVPSAFPNGCHVAEVEVDPISGVVEVVKYTTVNDFGTIINPLLVEGQVHGGVVQGIGQALLEMTAYSEDGQFLTGSYMDYALPRASDSPLMSFASEPAPATTNPLGAKGCGEAGCAGALPSVMNALLDALRELGVRHIDMPATPQRVWQAIRDAQRTKAA